MPYRMNQRQRQHTDDMPLQISPNILYLYVFIKAFAEYPVIKEKNPYDLNDKRMGKNYSFFYCNKRI